MSKYKKKVQKNIVKNKEKQKEEFPTKNKIMSFAKTVFAIIVLAIAVSIIAIAANDNYHFADKEVTISYDEIIAGQAFTRSEETYYVAFYEFNSSEDLSSTISELSSKNKVYKVNLKSAMNKDIIALKGNNKANSAEELQIAGPTLIKIEKGKNVNYVEGFEQIKTYLNSL